jgi:hypothetical protein
MEKKHNEAAYEHSDRHAKQQAAVILHDNAKDRQVADDSTGHDSGCEQCTQPGMTLKEQKDRGDQFNKSGNIPPSGLKPYLGENINRFLRTGELEEQRLQQNHRGDRPASPTQNERYL